MILMIFITRLHNFFPTTCTIPNKFQKRTKIICPTFFIMQVQYKIGQCTSLPVLVAVGRQAGQTKTKPNQTKVSFILLVHLFAKKKASASYHSTRTLLEGLLGKRRASEYTMNNL